VKSNNVQGQREGSPEGDVRFRVHVNLYFGESERLGFVCYLPEMQPLEKCNIYITSSVPWLCR